MPHRCTLVALLLFTACCLAASGAQAQPAEEAIVELELGFEGAYRVGKWTPVWVELQAGERELRGSVYITTPDGDSVPATYRSFSPPLQLAPGESAKQVVYVKFGRTSTWLEVELREAAEVRARRVFPAGSFPAPRPTPREVVLTLGGEVGVAAAAELSRRRGDDAYLPCTQTHASLLPTDWFGYESIDTVVLVTSNQEFLAKWTKPQVAALLQWVDQGGRLIVSSGGELPELWQAVYPGTYAETELLRRTTALEVYAGATQRLDLVSQQQFEMSATLLSPAEGRPLLSDALAGNRQPLFLLAPRGFGAILFSALDLSAPPLEAWRDRPRLLLRLLRMGAEQEPLLGDDQNSGGRVTHIGYKDLSGQLRAALEAFTFGGISLVPFSWVAGLIVFYILLIGPIDYFLLRRVIGRMEYTWITFPLMAIALAAVAVALTGLYKGDTLEMRQLAIADLDLASGASRETTWTHVYSPANARYNLATQANGPSLLSWHGLPGTALGGMETRSSGSTSDVRYLLANPDPQPATMAVVPQGVPINVWSTKSFVAQGWSSTPRAAAATALEQAKLRETYDSRLLGQFANPTKYELVDCQLLYDRWAYPIRGTLAPGDRIFLADEGEPRDLEWKMTRRIVNDDNKPVSSPWNPTELDIPRIAEMIMFHRAAGGVGYTELTDRQWQSLDLSSHLKLGRAVFIGRVKTPPAGLTLQGEPLQPAADAQWMYIRVVIPVEPAK